MLVVERSSVILVGGEASFRVFEEVGSGTLTVRLSCFGDAALLVLNPAAVAKVPGLTAPSGC